MTATETSTPMKTIVTVEGSRGKDAKDKNFLDKLFGNLKKNKDGSKDSKGKKDSKQKRETKNRKDS